jgi:catechol 2,3-dioxygenase-like lactoylglutathione lyase family enzyme
MFDHLGIVFRDLRMAGAFYRGVLTPLGIKLTEDHTGTDGTGWLVFSTGAAESPFFWWRPAGQASGQTSTRPPGAPRTSPSGRHRALRSTRFTAPASRRVPRTMAIPE